MKATALVWRKSSHSDSGGGNCVEVAVSQRAVLVRDSKEATRAHVTVSAGAWGAFAASAGQGDV